MNGARELTLSLGGRWYASYGAAPCPVCQPEGRSGQDALTLKDGRKGLLAHCKRSDCNFRDILAAAGLAPGTFAAPDRAELARRIAVENANAIKRSDQASALWAEASPISGTLAETYLRGRGITCDLPDTLRFAPACWHPSAQRIPAMVAMVDGAERFSVHRTYLRPDGSGKAGVEPAKAMLGSTQGGAVRLADGHNGLVVCEGLETGLSLASGLLLSPGTIWAALSTSGMIGLRLPRKPGLIRLAPDGDAAGRAAAVKLAERAYALGWTVNFINPPDGCDWNDVLQGRKAA